MPFKSHQSTTTGPSLLLQLLIPLGTSNHYQSVPIGKDFGLKGGEPNATDPVRVFPLHLLRGNVLGHLKFSAKGSKREVFGMTIPNDLINDVIRGADYYDAYLEKVAQHQRYIAGEELSDPESPAPKPAKLTKQAKPKATEQSTVSKSKAKTSKPAPAKSQEMSASQCQNLIDEFIDEGVPATKPSLEDTEEAILQKVLEESLTDAYPTQKGPLPPVVFREPDTGKLQPLPEVPGKGTRECWLDQIHGTIDEGQDGWIRPGTRDEGQAGTNPDDDAEIPYPLPTPSFSLDQTLNTRMLRSLIPTVNPFLSIWMKGLRPWHTLTYRDLIHLMFMASTKPPQSQRCNKQHKQNNFPLPPQLQQGSSESLLIKRMGELEQHIADV
ncbi:hypothetical protein Tco_1017690 [Tanacetum coccineum]|uniref:Histone deacetylase 14 n=1 Tax=Tanacetum coccineum TaxID=301880 RepID=A0ABQ5FTK4_9ASTR